MKNKFFLILSISLLTITSAMNANITLWMQDNEIIINNKTYEVSVEYLKNVLQYGYNGPHLPQIKLADSEGKQVKAQFIPLDWINNEDNPKHNDEWLRYNAIPKIPADAIEYRSKVYDGLSYIALVLENK